MRHYEIIFLVHPDQSEQVPAMIERYRNTIEGKGGKIHRLDASKLQGLGLAPSFAPASQFSAQLADDLAFFTVMLKELGIRLEN